MTYKIKDKTMMHIPLTEIISNILKNKCNKSMIADNHVSKDETLLSFNDSLLYKNCKYFTQKPDALQFILYYNKLEVCNPLGSKAAIR